MRLTLAACCWKRSKRKQRSQDADLGSRGHQTSNTRPKPIPRLGPAAKTDPFAKETIGAGQGKRSRAQASCPSHKPRFKNRIRAPYSARDWVARYCECCVLKNCFRALYVLWVQAVVARAVASLIRLSIADRLSHTKHDQASLKCSLTSAF